MIRIDSFLHTYSCVCEGGRRRRRRRRRRSREKERRDWKRSV